MEADGDADILEEFAAVAAKRQKGNGHVFVSGYVVK